VVEATRSCFPDLGTVDAFSWSPDGGSLLVDGVGRIPLRRVDVSTGQVSDLTTGDDPALLDAVRAKTGRSERWCGFSRAAWSHSGRFVATDVCFTDAVVPAIFSAEGGFVTLAERSERFSDVLGWSPAQDVLAYVTGFPPSHRITQLHLLDALTGEDRLLLTTGSEEDSPVVVGIAWSPSGRWLAMAIWTPQEVTVRVVDVTGGEAIREFGIDFNPADVSEPLVDWAP
jgi:tricorn protease-like protein